MSLNHARHLPLQTIQRENQIMAINTHETYVDGLLSADNPLVDIVFITTYTGMTDKWFYKLIKDGQFPKPIKLGRSSRWLQSEVERWLQDRIQASRTQD